MPGATSPESGVKSLINSLNVPIDFYGRVIDQNSNGLPGVRIVALVQHQLALGIRAFQLAATNLVVERITGPDGTFEISGVSGSGFDLDSIDKEGFEAEPTRRGFGAQEGSFENPIIFKMWPTNLHEPLRTGTKPFHIEPDGRAYVIDLEHGVLKESGPGNLRIWGRRPTPIAYGKRYDWSCEIDGIDGTSLAKEPDLGASMYEAPERGYTGSFKFEEPATVNGWGDSTGVQRFYVKLENGQEYGRISIEVYAYYNGHIPGLLRLSYVINPSGSRILR